MVGCVSVSECAGCSPFNGSNSSTTMGPSNGAVNKPEFEFKISSMRKLQSCMSNKDVSDTKLHLQLRILLLQPAQVPNNAWEGSIDSTKRARLIRTLFATSTCRLTLRA